MAEQDPANPSYYQGGERETIDLMRDESYVWADLMVTLVARLPQGTPPADIQDIVAKYLFGYFCVMSEMGYVARKGKKGTEEDWANDAKKAAWYRQMMQHVANPDKFPDPRAGRPNFQPYVRKT